MFESLDIRTPTVMVDRDRARENIDRMVERASTAGLRFRPHFKTHRSADVGRWFRDAGVTSITVSSVGMARYFASHGWSDITIAFPVNLRELDEIAALASSLELGVLVDSQEAVTALADRLDADASVWLKIDAGYGRAGVPWSEPGRAVDLARLVRESPRLKLDGILAYNGHTYAQRGAVGVRRVHAEAMKRLRGVKTELAGAGFEGIQLSVGDTPSASLADDFTGADELRPGNFVFNDLMQVEIGVCGLADIAVAVACPVVGVHADRLVLYGGSVHLSQEALERQSGERLFGSAMPEWPSDGTDGVPVVSLSQEHGIVEVNAGWTSSVALGDLVCVLPVHSCLTCNLHQSYLTTDGEVLRTGCCF